MFDELRDYLPAWERNARNWEVSYHSVQRHTEPVTNLCEINGIINTLISFSYGYKTMISKMQYLVIFKTMLWVIAGLHMLPHK